MGNKRRNLGDTQPMRPVNPQRAGRAERRTQRGQRDYREAYEREREYRRAVSRTPAPQNRSGQRSRSRQQESSLSAIIQRMRKKKKKEGTLKSVYDLDAEDREILAKTAGMKKDDAEKVAKKIRDDN